MKAIKGTYNNGQIKLSKMPTDQGPVEVLVVFPDPAEDPWEEILKEGKPRRAFAKFAEKCRDEIAKGKAKPLKLGNL